eukprot:230400-Rhodomonas_salina.1
MKPALLKQGFIKVEKEGLEVTDDVSIVEQLPAPVKITVRPLLFPICGPSRLLGSSLFRSLEGSRVGIRVQQARADSELGLGEEVGMIFSFWRAEGISCSRFERMT